MRSKLGRSVVAVVVLCGLLPLLAQEGSKPANPPAAPARAQFFHGTVTAVSSRRVTVWRSLVGRKPESRTFLIRSKTKINRTLKLKARVTVRYQHGQEGDIALEIQIHQPAPLPS